MATDKKGIPARDRFFIAGLSGFGASFFSHPFDLVKYRMQLSGKGGKPRDHKTSAHAVYNIITKEGPRHLYDGLSASLLRQSTGTTTRIGLHTALVDYFSTDGHLPPPHIQVACGMFAGALAAVVGNPADIALVRMAVDGGLPPKERYNYKNGPQAVYRIQKEEGIRTLWVGTLPHVLRLMVLNVTQIVLYKNVKVFLLTHTTWFKDDVFLHLFGSLLTAAVSAVCIAPIDLTKTRLMSMNAADGKREYKGVVDVWVKVIKKEGFFSIWKGVTATYARCVPNTVMIFFFLEFFTKAYKKYVLGDTTNTGY